MLLAWCGIKGGRPKRLIRSPLSKAGLPPYTGNVPDARRDTYIESTITASGMPRATFFCRTRRALARSLAYIPLSPERERETIYPGHKRRQAKSIICPTEKLRCVLLYRAQRDKRANKRARERGRETRKRLTTSHLLAYLVNLSLL